MKTERMKNWGFPRWGDYGQERDAEPVQMCDYAGCNERGEHPAPKSPSSSDRWHFCQPHAAEYNRNWDFFSGMSDEEAKKFMKDQNAESAKAFAGGRTFEWAGATDENGKTSNEQRAYDILEVENDADQALIKSQYRKLAKMYHPDSNPGDPSAAEKFHAVQTAYDLLKIKS